MTVWLTPTAREKLQHELAVLQRHTEGPMPDDANAIAVRRAQQGRIQQIHQLLVDAIVGEDPPDDGIAEPGMVLTVVYEGSGDTETFLLGVRGADYGDIEVYSTDSPLGSAISGARVGQQRSYELPTGVTQVVTVQRAVPYGLHETSAA